MTQPPHILVVDDHDEIRCSIVSYLQKHGMRSTGAGNAAEMDTQLVHGGVDLIVLDVMMPGEDGLSACARLRKSQCSTPILMLTALGDDAERIEGLDTGADDYLAKPFNPRELLARINAILRRASGPSLPHGGALAGRKVRFAGLVFDHDVGHVSAEDGTIAMLTTAEARLLSVFLERPREVIGRERLLELSSGRIAGPFDRTIDNQVSRLRRKIEPDTSMPRIISTIRNGGYCLNSDVVLED